MTTIAWDGKTLAADQAMTDAGRKVRFLGKLRRLKNGSLAAMAGHLSLCQALMDWLDDGALGEPLLHGKGDVLVVSPDGILRVYDKRGACVEVGETIYAMGSGCHLATGAMLAGATAKRAVEIAIERDGGSGFGVSTLTFKGRR